MMSDKTFEIEIDGKKLSARAGQMLIELADQHDIYIPRFCYHKKLSVAANCRMCLVEVEKAPKPLPACATPVMEGMKVATRSKFAIEAQKSVMEFLLINHPLDCPICDQGGECELQDLAVGYGSDVSRYQEKKRVVRDKDIGTLVQTDMTRCIHCTRCVRFGEEIAGLREMGATGRGEDMEIGTYIEKSLGSELSGNIIDICPVGALTSKPFRYSARAWEMVQRSAIAPHDSVGSNVQLHIKDDRVKRVVPSENETINEVWLSDRDRFSYQGLYSDDRLQTPMIKKDGCWQQVDWQTALEFSRDGLKNTLSRHGPAQLGGLTSATASLEELYLFQKLLRMLGCNNVDHRLRQKDFTQQEADPLFPYLGSSIAALETMDAVLLIGSNARREQPLINHRLRKCALQGGDVMVLNAVDHGFNYDLSAEFIQAPTKFPTTLALIAKSLAKMMGRGLGENMQELIGDAITDERHQLIAKKLLQAKHGLILLGNLSQAHSEFTTLKALATTIAKLANVKLGFLTEAANTSGAHLAGVLPHRGAGGTTVSECGLNADTMLADPRQAYLLLGVEPEFDCWNNAKALQAMHAADFVVSMTAYQSETMKQYADVLFPIALFAERAGTYINVAGQRQSFAAAIPPLGESRPAWKIMRVLADLLSVETMAYNNIEEIQHEIQHKIGEPVLNSAGDWSVPMIPNRDIGLQRITEVPMYRLDPMLRRATALQKADDSAGRLIQINSALANKLQLSAGDLVTAQQQEDSFSAPVQINENVAEDCVLVQATHQLAGPWHGQISLHKA